MEKLNEVMENGTEAEAKEFIVANLMKFPEEVRNELAVALFSDALENANAGLDQIKADKKEISDALTELE